MSSDLSEERPPRRSYDARRRRERAVGERLATRQAVVAAATRLFVARGYNQTTMAEIATEAGVALQSLYKAGRSKAELLHMVVDHAVAGDDLDVLVHDRPAYAAIATELDPERQVLMMADLICDIQERSRPVQAAYREAAAVDASVAASVEEAHRRRRDSFRAVIEMLPVARLRESPETSVDATWAIGSTEVHHLMRTTLGWDADRYRAWLGNTLITQLLTAADQHGRHE